MTTSTFFFLGRIPTLDAGQVARPGGFYARQVARQECGALGIEASDAGQECDAGKHKWHLCFRSGQVEASMPARPGGLLCQAGGAAGWRVRRL